MNKNLLKLAKMILALEETATDKAKLVHEGELAVGSEVFVEDENGELQPAEDGEYATEDKIIVVAEGKVTEIRDKEPEAQDPDQDSNPNTQQMDEEQQARIAELEAALEAKNAELEAKDAELADKDARIAELEAELEDLKSKLAESDARSAEEELKMNKQKPTNKGIKFDLFNK